ncbi:hypothetical protein [Niallia sp. NCCP-28]|uniref:hypothetical protein n=1 Tax=Niallia sp. NCCP-28 TaxID=2934712 RepID=UPI0020BFDC1D|nr:hypothetical protein [Niallia sp. NCCP-28]
MKKANCILISCFLLLIGNMRVYAAYSPDEFYTNLGIHEYKEYTGAATNIRKRLLGKELNNFSKEFGGYSFTVDSPNDEYYFFASVLDTSQIIIKKYAIYTPEGKRVEFGFNRQAKKASGFKGWDKPLDDTELFNKRERNIK